MDVVAPKKQPRGKKTKQILGDHKRQGRTLTPPLMQHGKLKEHSWFREMLPDFIWIAFMLGRRSDWKAHRSAMDVVDRFVPAGSRFADGRLTTFALVPPGRREEARDALAREAPHALPAVLGHIVGLYPDCPARWLYEDWLERNEPDPGIALPALRSFIEDHRDKSGVRETRLRMAAFSRRVVHGKMSHPGTGVWALVPRYPGNLTSDEQRQVESVIRASWMSFFGFEAEQNPELLAWPRDFWNRNRELASCQVRDTREKTEMPTMDGPVDPEPQLQLSELQRIQGEIDQVGESLISTQSDMLRNADADEGDSILVGLASRMYRLLCEFLDRPSAWAPNVAGLHLRPLVDTRILAGWLIKRDDPDRVRCVPRARARTPQAPARASQGGSWRRPR
jgi:hypothetical protein